MDPEVLYHPAVQLPTYVCCKLMKETDQASENPPTYEASVTDSSAQNDVDQLEDCMAGQDEHTLSILHYYTLPPTTGLSPRPTTVVESGKVSPQNSLHDPSTKDMTKHSIGMSLSDEMTGIHPHFMKPNLILHAFSLTSSWTRSGAVIYGRTTHSQLAVCGKEAGSLTKLAKGMIFVARSSQLAAKVCTRVLVAVLPSLACLWTYSHDVL